GPAVAGLAVALGGAALGHAPDVERPHRELGTRLANRLGGDDPDRHSLFDQCPSGQVHAVAQPADAERGLAGHWAADADLVETELLQRLGARRRDHLVFGHNRLASLQVADLVAAYPPADPFGQRAVHFVALVN